MPLSTRFLQLIENAFTLGVTLASDAIDSWSTQETRGHLLQRLREAVQRASELALENAKLKDDIDAMRFNGPSLYCDEVAALHCGASYLAEYRKDSPTTQAYVNAIMSLLNRCDHLPMTAQELADQIDDITSGRVKLVNWEDVFKSDDLGRDVDEDPMPCHCGWDFNYGDTCPHGTKGQGA